MAIFLHFEENITPLFRVVKDALYEDYRRITAIDDNNFVAKSKKAFKEYSELDSKIVYAEMLWNELDAIMNYDAGLDMEWFDYAEEHDCVNYESNLDECNKLIKVMQEEMAEICEDIQCAEVIDEIKEGKLGDDDYLDLKVIRGELHGYTVGTGGPKTIFARPQQNPFASGIEIRVLDTRVTAKILMQKNPAIKDAIDAWDTLRMMIGSNQPMWVYADENGFSEYQGDATCCKKFVQYMENAIKAIRADAEAGKVLTHLKKYEDGDWVYRDCDLVKGCLHTYLIGDGRAEKGLIQIPEPFASEITLKKRAYGIRVADDMPIVAEYSNI